MIYDGGGGGVSLFLISSDKECRGIGLFLILDDNGGGGVYKPLFLAAIICEQPLKQFTLHGKKYELHCTKLNSEWYRLQYTTWFRSKKGTDFSLH